MEMKDLRVEPKLTGYLFSKASRCKVPLSGTFELSPECNFRCGMCSMGRYCKTSQSRRNALSAFDWWRTAFMAGFLGTLRDTKQNGLFDFHQYKWIIDR